MDLRTAYLVKRQQQQYKQDTTILEKSLEDHQVVLSVLFATISDVQPLALKAVGGQLQGDVLLCRGRH